MNELEKQILAVIASTHPYALHEVEMVYRRCKSYDKTIEILETALANGITTTDVLNARNYGSGLKELQAECKQVNDEKSFLALNDKVVSSKLVYINLQTGKKAEFIKLADSLNFKGRKTARFNDNYEFKNEFGKVVCCDFIVPLFDFGKFVTVLKPNENRVLTSDSSGKVSFLREFDGSNWKIID